MNKIDPNGLTWYYDQRTGAIHWDDPATAPCDFVYKENGFSGKKGKHRNNPSSENIKSVGPIPSGKYTIGNRRACKSNGKPLDNFLLIPDASNEMFGRAHFLIHGGSEAGDPSEGCIIASKALRDVIEKSKDKELVVYDSQNPSTWTPEMWDCLAKLEAAIAPSSQESGNLLLAVSGLTPAEQGLKHISLTFISLMLSLTRK